MTSTQETVWCASYPKSGNTWLRAIFSGLLGDGTVRLRSLPSYSAGNDQRAIFRELGLTPSVLADEVADDLLQESCALTAERAGMPVIRKTHNVLDDSAPRSMRHQLRTPTRAVYVVRDPRAVAVSLAYHLGRTQAEAVSIMRDGPSGVPAQQPAVGAETSASGDRFITRGCQVAFNWEGWSTNVLSWVDQSRMPVKVLRYEDLRNSTLEVVSDLVNWLGWQVPAEVVSETVAQSSFAQLSVQELMGGFVEAVDADRQFFRRGSADSWVEELSPGLADQIVVDHAEVMRRFGYLA